MPAVGESTRNIPTNQPKGAAKSLDRGSKSSIPRKKPATGKKALAAGKGKRSRGRQHIGKRQRYLGNDLPDMLFGFGDVDNPLQSTVDTVEDVVVSFLQSLIVKATKESVSGGRLSETELLMQVRKFPRKYHRARELLDKWKQIQTVRYELIYLGRAYCVFVSDYRLRCLLPG